MKIQNLKQTCKHCDGTGKQYNPDTGAQFKEWRTKLNLTQTAAVSSANIAEVGQLSRFENGRKPLPAKNITALIAFYTETEKGLKGK